MPHDGPRLILLVDDDANTLEAFRLLLESEGLGVVTA
jgi:CheY-like chemotaxis protein